MLTEVCQKLTELRATLPEVGTEAPQTTPQPPTQVRKRGGKKGEKKPPSAIPPPLGRVPDPRDVLGLDLEMITVADSKTGKCHMWPATVAIANGLGESIYYCYVTKPPSDSPLEVKSLNTRYSGIHHYHYQRHYQLPLEQVQQEVAALIRGRVVTGTGLRGDFNCLQISSQDCIFRSSENYEPGKLKVLAAKYLGSKIQSGEHNAMEDAIASAKIYMHRAADWEKISEVAE